MFRPSLFASVLCGLLVSAARADLPLPSHQRHVDPAVRIDGIEDYPGYVFFVWFYSTGGGPMGCPPTLIAVKDSHAFRLGAQRRIFNMAVLAMPRADFE